MNKIYAVAIFGTMAAMSQAVVFNVVSVGTYTLSASGYSTSETVVAQITPSSVTSMSFVATYAGTGANGTITYTGANGTIDLAFTAPGPFELAGNTSALDGTWTFVSGTGDYAGYASGTGTFGATYNATGTYASTTLSGDLNPVPEPATMAVLGLGLAAAARRRRRA